MTPGIYSIPADQYHAAEGISSHGLNALAISPLHYWTYFRNPERQPKKDTPAGILGDAIHTAILEPERFEKEYIREPNVAEHKGVLDTLPDYKQACKERGLKVTGTKPELKSSLIASGCQYSDFWDDLYADLVGSRKVLSEADWRVTKAIVARVRKHPVASQLFQDGKPEQSIFWDDPETGVRCRGRIDWVPYQTASCPPYILDIKSARSAHPKAFQRSIISYKYHVQAAFYLDGLQALTGQPIDQFLWVAWEKVSPYAPALYWAQPDLIEAGRQEYKALLRIYADCLAKDEWPGYSSNIEPIGLPEWYQPGNSESEQEEDWLEVMSNE